MKLLTFLIISLIPTIKSSTKCKNPQLKCIELCCGEMEFYNVAYKNCEDYPEDARASWDTFMHDNKTIREAFEIVPYSGCKTNATIPSCYSPNYSKESNQFYLQNLSDVPCIRYLKPSNLSWTMSVLAFYFVLPICLSIMSVYTYIKGQKEQLTDKLVACYLMSMSGFMWSIFAFKLHTALTNRIVVEGSIKYYKDIFTYFFISTWLWLNVVGIHIWSVLKGLSVQDNADQSDKRLVYRCIYVWGFAALLHSIQFLPTANAQYLYYIFDKGIHYGIPCFNLLTYLILSVNIVMTRYGVSNLTNEPWFKLKLTSLVLRLGIAMGFPRMTFLALKLVIDPSVVIYTCLLHLEPFVIFTVLVWKPTKCFNRNFVLRCCRCRKKEEISHPTELVEMCT